MPLTGEARTTYMRQYMRRKRAEARLANPTPEQTQENASIRALEIEVEKWRDKAKVLRDDRDKIADQYDQLAVGFNKLRVAYERLIKRLRRLEKR